MTVEPTIEELKQEIAELRRALVARDEFVSVVAHELRNPISPLYMQISVMREKVARSSEVDRDWLESELARLTTRAEYFIGCLDRLLDISQLDDARIQLHPGHHDLVAIVRAAISSFPEVRRLGITVTLDADSSLHGRWDRMRLEQVVGNLLSNAIRYGLGKPIHCTVDCDERGWARLRVQDQGVGIAASELPRIFDRFHRVGDTRRTTGFGIGLWVIAEICRAMKGEVRVESALGLGTTFTVCLPRE